MNDRRIDLAALVLRLTLGTMLIAHGLLKVVVFTPAGTAAFFEQIGNYGAENLHYVGDVGSFTLAYGIALLVAVGRRSWWVPMLALGAIWYGLHALNHLFDVGEARSDARGWADTLLLAGTGVAEMEIEVLFRGAHPSRNVACELRTALRLLLRPANPAKRLLHDEPRESCHQAVKPPSTRSSAPVT